MEMENVIVLLPHGHQYNKLSHLAAGVAHFAPRLMLTARRSVFVEIPY